MNKSNIIHIAFWVLSALTALMFFIDIRVAMAVFFLWWISLFLRMRVLREERKERLQNYGNKIREHRK